MFEVQFHSVCLFVTGDSEKGLLHHLLRGALWEERMAWERQRLPLLPKRFLMTGEVFHRRHR